MFEKLVEDLMKVSGDHYKRYGHAVVSLDTAGYFAGNPTDGDVDGNVYEFDNGSILVAGLNHWELRCLCETIIFCLDEEDKKRLTKDKKKKSIV